MGLFFNALYNIMEVSIKHFLHTVAHNVCLKEGTWGTVMVPAELAALFTEHHFYLKEKLTDKLWVFRLGVSGRYFLKKWYFEGKNNCDD